MIETKGQKVPRPVSNHTSVVYENNMFLFGGSDGAVDNNTFFKLDLNKYIWSEVKQKQYSKEELHNFPNTRDEHSCCLYNDSMVIFGGFHEGERVNEIFHY